MANYIVTFYDKKKNTVTHEVAVSYSSDVVVKSPSVLPLAAISKLRENGYAVPSAANSSWSYRLV